MKHLWIVVLVMLLPALLSAQSKPGVYERAKLLKTYTTFTATSDDTISYSINASGLGDLMQAREYGLIAVASDSVSADVYVDPYNAAVYDSAGVLEKIGTAYADSLVPGTTVWTAGTPYIKVIPLKSTTLDRLAGATQFKLGTVFRATLNGTTAGRFLKWYLYWVK